MKGHWSSHLRTILSVWALALFVAAPRCLVAEPTPTAVSAFNEYVSVVESRLNQQHRGHSGFLASVAPDPEAEERLRRGELLVEQLTPPGAAVPAGAMLHHWRGTAFAAGARASDFERLMKDFGSYSQYFQPQVLRANVLSRQGDHFQVLMRVRQHHAITVVMDTTYDVTFGQLDHTHGYSISRSIRIAEIDSPGTSGEHELNAGEDHGFIWRLNTYWSYEERDGGLYMQIESVSLTRDIPRGFAWVLRPFVQSIPRESLEFTLGATCNALREKH